MTNRTTDLPEKTNLNANDLVTGLDSEDSNLSTKDKVFSIDNIGDKVFTDRTTDNLTEGVTNLYLNETNLGSSTTIQNLQNNKADKSNVLELDNTTPYTPTAQYHPVTKDYVDNMSIPLATETTPGIVEKATDTETLNGVSNKYPDSASIYNTYTFRTILASDTIRFSNNAEIIRASTSLGLIRSTFINESGTLRVVFDGIENNLNFSSTARIYKNGVAVGTQRSLNETYTTFSEDISVKATDTIEIWGDNCKIRNFQIKFDINVRGGYGYNIN